MNIWTSAFGWERQCQESADLPDELDEKKKNPVQARHEHASLNTRLCNTYAVREGYIYILYIYIMWWGPLGSISHLGHKHVYPPFFDRGGQIPSCFYLVSPLVYFISLYFKFVSLHFTSFHFLSKLFHVISLRFTLFQICFISFHFILNLFHFVSLYFKFVSLHFTCLYSFQICFTSFHFHFISLRLTYLFFLSPHFTS